MNEKSTEGKSIQWKHAPEFFITLLNGIKSLLKDPKTTSGVFTLLTFLATVIGSLVNNNFWEESLKDSSKAFKDYWYISVPGLVFLISFAFFLYYLLKFGQFD